MKQVTSFLLVAVVAFAALMGSCGKHHGAAQVPVIDYTAPVTGARLWSGTFTDSTYYRLKPAVHTAFKDTSLAISRVSDRLISVPCYQVTLGYSGTDSANHVVKFDTTMGAIKSSLAYNYATDSMVFYYYQYLPTEQPEEWIMNLISVK